MVLMDYECMNMEGTKNMGCHTRISRRSFAIWVCHIRTLNQIFICQCSIIGKFHLYHCYNNSV